MYFCNMYFIFCDFAHNKNGESAHTITWGVVKMAKMKKNAVMTGVITGLAVGTATTVVSSMMSRKSVAVKKNAGKAISAVASMISAMQG